MSSSAQVSPTIFSAGQALVIGVGEYLHPQFCHLPATIRDAQSVASLLVDPNLCGYDPARVQVVTGKLATGDAIRELLTEMARSSDRESTALLYFSGHGGRAAEPDGWHTYLCTHEADPDRMASTAISGDEFSALLSHLPDRRLLVILDACHAGGSVDLLKGDGEPSWKAGLPDDYYEALSRGSGRVVIASSKEGQYSFVRRQNDVSLFTWYFLQALRGQAGVRGDGLIHVLDVFHYVSEMVQAEDLGQNPILKAQDLDLNFAIGLDRSGAKSSSDTSQEHRIVAEIRDRLIHNPIDGARALSEYLGSYPHWTDKRHEVDLKRAEIVRAQHDLDLFGQNPTDQAIKNRAVYFLLRICADVEQSAIRR